MRGRRRGKLTEHEIESMAEMVDWVRETKCKGIAKLYEYAKNERPDDWLPVFFKRHDFWDAYFETWRYKYIPRQSRGKKSESNNSKIVVEVD